MGPVHPGDIAMNPELCTGSGSPSCSFPPGPHCLSTGSWQRLLAVLTQGCLSWGRADRVAWEASQARLSNLVYTLALASWAQKVHCSR